MSRTLNAVAIALAFCCLSGARAESVQPVQAPKTVEMVFVLDTTGSMGGLLTGAKTKIWNIVNEVMQRRNAQNVKVGLVAYRDRRDQYVTQVTPLTADLDEVYRVLMEYKAVGGGDQPEDVRAAMRDALDKTGWSAASADLSQIMFLVGDAPPHDDYKDTPSTQTTAERARQRGIFVNAVQCGTIASTTPVWRSIAQYGGGEYFAIAQDGGVRAVTTPYDVELGALGSKLGSTYMAYGKGSERVARESKQQGIEHSVADMAPAPAKADRALNKAINAKAYDASDLVQSVENKEIQLEAIKTEDLPEIMQRMSMAERKVYIDKQITERTEIRAKIVDLSRQRDKFIAGKSGDATGRSNDSFDAAVSAALSKQIP